MPARRVPSIRPGVSRDVLSPSQHVTLPRRLTNPPLSHANPAPRFSQVDLGRPRVARQETVAPVISQLPARLQRPPPSSSTYRPTAPADHHSVDDDHPGIQREPHIIRVVIVRPRNPASTVAPALMDRMENLLLTLATMRANLPPGSTLPAPFASLEIDDIISAASEQRLLILPIEESPVEAQTGEQRPPPPPPRPVHPETYLVRATEVRDELECTICLNRFRHMENVVKVKCGHLFHEECLQPWIEQHDTCPMCRGYIGD
jgi:hypothetical protein